MDPFVKTQFLVFKVGPRASLECPEPQIPVMASAPSYHHLPVFPLPVDLCRRPVSQCLVRPVVVVELEVLPQPLACLPRGTVLMQVHFLVLHAPPQALREDVVVSPSSAVHADSDPGGTHQFHVLRAGVLAALVTVDDLRLGHGQLASRLWTHWGLSRIGISTDRRGRDGT